jgi:polygalacturonase
VHISNCHISVGDDCITIKSGKDAPGRAKATPAENYTITNCTMLSGHGGVVIGSEMSGGVKKITISNCIFDGTDRGIRIKTTRGRGGVVEDIRVDNIVMKGIRQEAIMLDMEYSKTAPEAVSERTPQFRNIRLSNITAYTNKAMYINGLSEMPVSEISLTDAVFEAQTGITIRNSHDIELHQVRVNTQTGPSLTVENTNRLLVNGLSAAKTPGNAPLLKITNVQEALIQNCWPFSATHVFAEVNGAQTDRIVLKNNMVAKDAIVINKEVSTQAVQQLQ